MLIQKWILWIAKMWSQFVVCRLTCMPKVSVFLHQVLPNQKRGGNETTSLCKFYSYYGHMQLSFLFYFLKHAICNLLVHSNIYFPFLYNWLDYYEITFISFFTFEYVDILVLLSQGDQRSPGIIPLAVKDAFSIIQEVHFECESILCPDMKEYT